jgi:gamma-glutamylputrescine oxidase
MVRHQPYWFDRFPRSRRPAYPPFRGSTDVRVVIVGGGLIGCACAVSFASAGIRTIVLEADRLGAGATAGGAGVIREDFDASFIEASRAHGLRAARHLWQGMRRASLDFAAVLRRLAIRCDLAPQDLVNITRPGGDAARLLRREYQARRDAGLEHSWLTPAAITRTLAVDAGGGIRTRGAALDPYRACVSLAAAAASRGASIFERSRVRRVRAGRKHVDIVTAAGSLRAEAVLIATNDALPDLRALRRHLHPEQGYAVVTEPLPSQVRRELGSRTAAIRDDASPPHFLRWLKDDRVLFAGADQMPAAPRTLDKVLHQRTGQLMYELSTIYPPISGAMPEWSWAYSHHATVDGLPYVGLHRNFPRHLFALGSSRHGAGVAWLAARVLLRAFTGEPARGDEAFGFARILASR